MIGDGRFKRYRQTFELRDPDDPCVLLSVEDTETSYWAQVIVAQWELDMAKFDLEEWEYSRLIDQLKHAASDRAPAHRKPEVTV